MMYLLTALLATGISGLSVDLIKRGACMSSSCMGTQPATFEEKYNLGAPIAGRAPVFKCTERATHIQYVCKFPRVDQIINQLPAEIAVLKAINDSIGNGKRSFVEIHEYYNLNVTLTLPLPLISSDFFPHYINCLNDYIEMVPLHVEVLKLYDTNWVNGLKFIETNPNRTEGDVINIFFQLFSGIKYLYDIGYSHSDIKRKFNSITNIVNNFLVNRKTLKVKIIDLDVAQTVNEKRKGLSKAWIGTRMYIPPEIVRHKKYSLEKAEVWELGVVLFKLLFTEYPFANESEILNLDILPKIIEKSKIYRRFESRDKIDFLEWMLSKDPYLRPSFDDIYHYFRSIWVRR